MAVLVERHGRGPVRAAIREALERRRSNGADASGVEREVADTVLSGPVRVINGSGVILNTNLGRARLADVATAAMADASGYCDLEWDRGSGERGSRHSHLERLLARLTGAEDGIAVNTNAGAVLLALVACAAGSEAVVSRGQLVEIGGGFRVPDILEASGCRLVEVGTTNRTRIADYEAAIGDDTRVLLRVHQANFTMDGFVEETPLAELAALADARSLTLIDDLGSGLLDATDLAPGEPDASASVAAGCDLVCFSADKLLGGPQAGIVVGTKEHIGRLRGHPLARALRLDKFRVAALAATLRLYLDPVDAVRRIPTLAALAEDGGARRERARRLADALGWEAVATTARVGGGALPAHTLESAAVVAPGSPAKIAARLRMGVPAVATRVHDGQVLIDAAALSDGDVDELIGICRELR